MVLNTKTQIPNSVDAQFSAVLLAEGVPNLPHNMFADRTDIDRNSGTDTLRLRRYSNLSPATTPLVEGTTPGDTTLSLTNIEVTPQQYGAFVQFTDKVNFTVEEPFVREVLRLQALQWSETFDTLAREILNAGTSVFYPAGRTARNQVAAGDVLTQDHLMLMSTQLLKNKARKITGFINASQGVSTAPGDFSYVAITSFDVANQIRNFADFNPAHKYGDVSQRMSEFEIGQVRDVRIIASSNAKVFAGAGAGSVDVHTIIMMGQGAYGQTRITGESLQSVVKPFGEGGLDPLNQRATIGWKGTYAAVITNQANIVRGEVAL